jgi:hypothetical protein
MGELKRPAAMARDVQPIIFQESQILTVDLFLRLGYNLAAVDDSALWLLRSLGVPHGAANGFVGPAELLARFCSILKRVAELVRPSQRALRNFAKQAKWNSLDSLLRS